MSQEQTAPRRLWSDPVYERLPLSPMVAGAIASGLLLGVLAVLAVATGELAALAEQERSWWQTRDARLAVLLALLAATLPTALRYHELGTRRDLEALERANLWHGVRPELLEQVGWADPRKARLYACTGLFAVPLVASLVDRDPALYLTSAYWHFGQIWTWVVGTSLSVLGAVFTYRVSADARAFAALARALPTVDLLERGALLPFARQGLRSAMPGVLMLTFLALNITDEGFLAAILLLGGLALVQNVALLLIPIRGLHDRLRDAKREELARVHAAIRGERGALRGSPLDGDDARALADLLAWRAFVESVPEWPIDASTLGRFAFYVGLPLLSWVGAALVERAIDVAIG